MNSIAEQNQTEWTIDKIRSEAETLVESERFAFCHGDEEHEKNKNAESILEQEAMTFSSEKIVECLYRNQIGDADLFQEIYRGHYLYDHAAGRWYKWAAHYWEQDKNESSVAAVQGVSAVYESELKKVSWRVNSAAARGKPDEEAEILEKDLRKRIILLQTRSRIMDVLALARTGDKGLGTDGEHWDSNPMLLGCLNGIVNLEDGSFRDGKPSDMIKTVCPVIWEGIDAPASRWERFQLEICDNNEQLVAFKQRLYGYCITGKITEQRYPICYGRGRNGKGVELETIKEVTGDYTGVLPIESIIQQKHGNTPGGARSDLIALQGKRLIYSAESADGNRLNVSKMKSLTGGDSISARAVYGKNQITFKPTHKLLLQTNYKPLIPADDYAAWQRVLLIPYNLSFVDEPKAPNERKKDPNLKTKLEKELSGILAWLVRGCLEWQKQGLNPPEIVKAATENYRNENDSLSDFIKSCCEETGETQAKVLFDAYKDFCEESGKHPLNSNNGLSISLA